MTALSDFLSQNGRLPRVSLMIKPLDDKRPAFAVSTFISYSFDSSVLVPVDSFSFVFKNPGTEGSILDFVREGDVAILRAHETEVCTGIIDTIEIEVTEEGEIVHVQGRDLMAQLEDQNSVSLFGDPLWANKYTVGQAAQALLQNTHIPGIQLKQAPSGPFLFATDPSETKLSSLLRFIEPLNCLTWMDPSGKINIGRPNMAQKSIGTVSMDAQNRRSNVTSMKATRTGTQIPNIIVPIWAGQETVQSRIGKEQQVVNPAEGPSRLLRHGYKVPKTVVVSTPSGSDPQSLSDINQITIAGSNLLQAYAKREIARANIHEMIVQANVPGHWFEDLTPFLVDQCWHVSFPRAGVDEKMYLYQVTYTLDQEGPKTSLMFCKLGRIVADIAIQEVTAEIIRVFPAKATS